VIGLCFILFSFAARVDLRSRTLLSHSERKDNRFYALEQTHPALRHWRVASVRVVGPEFVWFAKSIDGRAALMRFASVYPFVGAAKRAHPGFDLFYQPERGTALPLSRAPADQAFHAEPGQSFVKLGRFLDTHFIPSGESLSRNGHRRQI
jgi:hypothetical protein